MLQPSNPFQIVSNHFYRDNSYGNLIKDDAMVVMFDNLPDYYQYMVQVLEESLDISLNNLGLAKLSKGVLYHCLGYFGLKLNDAGEYVMGLELGYHDDNKYSSVFVPCKIEKNERVIGNSKKITTYDYSLNGWKIELIKPNVELDKYYIHLTVLDTPKTYQDKDGNDVDESDLDEADLRFEYTFPLLVNKNSKDDIKKFWSVGKFQECLREFGKFKVYGQTNKLFIDLFSSDKFPKEGVALLCNNGVKRVALAGSHPKITKDIHSANWEIVATSHPELLVRVSTDYVQLGDVTDIQFTNANNGNEGYKFLSDDTYSDYVLIHIVGKNASNITHTPTNIVAANPKHILSVLEKFPNFVATVDKYISLPSPSTVVAKLPAKVVSGIAPKQKVVVDDDGKELDDILF